MSRKTIADLFHHVVTARVVLVISLLLTLLGWYVANEYAKQRAMDRFHFKVKEAQLAISKRMLEYEQVLRGGVGLFYGSTEVTRQERKPGFDLLGHLRQPFGYILGGGHASHTLHPRFGLTPLA